LYAPLPVAGACVRPVSWQTRKNYRILFATTLIEESYV
jgi:hypothetical protein